MTVEFQDMEERSNPWNGTKISNEEELSTLLHSLRDRDPFFFELSGENGYNLLMGSGPEIGCIQYSSSNGEPPYRMAFAPTAQNTMSKDCMEFLIGHTSTPVPVRYCLPSKLLKQVVMHFLRTGERSPDVLWEEI